jgi:hypothetical protein
MAYVASDHTLHILTLDGKTNLTGPVLSSPVYAAEEGLAGYAVIAPDGRAIAYPGGVINLRPGAPGPAGIQSVGDGVRYYWSPDSTHVLSPTFDASGNTSWEVFEITTAQSTPLPIPSDDFVIGWIDTTHLAVYSHPHQTSFFLISALDTTTGALRKVATVSTENLGNPYLNLSPDGSTLLLTNSGGEGIPSYVPVAELITTGTGQIRPLPTILRAFPYGIGGWNFAWKPGSQLVLIPGYPSYLLDLAHDTAAPFVPGVEPIGWAPDTGLLYVSTVPPGAPGSLFTYQVSTMAAPPPATAMQPVFRIQSTLFPYLGLVRSA